MLTNTSRWQKNKKRKRETERKKQRFRRRTIESFQTIQSEKIFLRRDKTIRKQNNFGYCDNLVGLLKLRDAVAEALDRLLTLYSKWIMHMKK